MKFTLSIFLPYNPREQLSSGTFPERKLSPLQHLAHRRACCLMAMWASQSPCARLLFMRDDRPACHQWLIKSSLGTFHPAWRSDQQIIDNHSSFAYKYPGATGCVDPCTLGLSERTGMHKQPQVHLLRQTNVGKDR